MANKIETAISKAQQHEAKHRSMENEIVARYQKLHRSIKIVDREKVQALLSFTQRYINLVPKLIAMASVCAEQTHIIKYVGPFIEAAEQFFFMPLEGNLHDQESLPTLLEEAYLAHRLFEEANDLLIEKTGYPLIPVDLTMANLIAHDLIGEPYANELDMMAAIFASKMPCIKFMQEMKALTEQIKYEKSCGHWDEVWSKWSTFDKEQVLSLSIKLNS